MRISLRLTDLSPFGPIFGKELRTTSRRRRNHVLRVAYLGGLLLFLLLAYVSTGLNRGYYGVSNVAARVQQQNQLGQSFFLMFSCFCIVTMGLIAPVLTSTAISAERLGKTLPILLMTPITSWQIVWGKLLSRLLIALMLIGLSLPVLALVRLLGGVELEQMVCTVVMCVAFAFGSAAIGLFFSTLLSRAYAVILLSYATMILLYGLAPILTVALFIAINQNPNPFRVFWWIQTTNPLLTVFLNAMPDAPRMLRGNWQFCLAAQAGLTFALMTISSWIIRRRAKREGEGAPSTPALTTAAPSDAVAPQVPAAALVPAAQVTFEVGNNPVLWRELRRPLMTRGWARFTAAVVLALLLLSYLAFGTMHGTPLADTELHIIYCFAFCGLWWLLIAVLSSTVIAQEKESDTWTLLLATPISARAIVLGKLLGLSRRMIWPTLLIALHFVIFAFAGITSFPTLLLVLWVIITFNTLWAALGVYLSLRVRKVTTAVVASLIIPIALYALAPVVLLIVGELIGQGENLAEQTLWYLPYFYLGEGITRLQSNFGLDAYFWLPGLGRQRAESFLFAAFIVGVLHLAAAAGIVFYAIRRFNRIIGRAAQNGRIEPLQPAKVAQPSQ